MNSNNMQKYKVYGSFFCFYYGKIFKEVIVEVESLDDVKSAVYNKYWTAFISEIVRIE